MGRWEHKKFLRDVIQWTNWANVQTLVTVVLNQAMRPKGWCAHGNKSQLKQFPTELWRDVG